MNDKDMIVIGKTIKVHGITGKIEISFTDDVFLRTDTSWLFLKLDGIPVPFFIEDAVKKGNGRALLKLEDVDDIKKASSLIGADILFPINNIPERDTLPDNWHFLQGFTLSDIHYGHIGTVTGVNDNSANIILFVQREDNSEVLIPLHTELVVAFNDKKRELTMELPEGLLSINE